MDPIYKEKQRMLDQINQLRGMYPDKTDPKIEAATLEKLEHYEAERARRNQEAEDQLIRQALQHAITETIQRIAMTIINERREEIEAACNFGELRDTLAAELARQFMASRLTGQPTPFDNPVQTMPASRAQAQLKHTTLQGLGYGASNAMPSPGYAKGVKP